MSRVSMNVYQKNALDNGVQTFTLLPDAMKKYGVRKNARVPKMIEVHMPDTEEAQLNTDERFAKSVVEAVGKMLGV